MHDSGACMAGGMHGRGACMAGGHACHSRYYGIWLMSGRYASYWNAFLLRFRGFPVGFAGTFNIRQFRLASLTGTLETQEQIHRIPSPFEVTVSMLHL